MEELQYLLGSKIFKMKSIKSFLIFSSFFFLLGCSISSPTSEVYVVDADEIATLVMATMDVIQAQTVVENADSTQAPDKLPQSLFFISERSGMNQVWRIERDGIRIDQITFSERDIIGYDINQEYELLVYVTRSQLVVQGLLSITPDVRLKLDIVETSNAPGKYFTNPRFSPDGLQIAFAQNGLKILDLLSGESRVLFENTYEDIGSEESIPLALYYPESYSPDGTHLLMSTANDQRGTLSFLNLQTLEKTDFQSSGIVCCQTIWALDSASVLVASPYLELVDSGLWRYELTDGAENKLILSSGPDAIINFVGWPYEYANGDLQLFYSQSAGIPNGNVPLFMVSAKLKTLDQTVSLREDAFFIQEAIWAPDGSLAIIIPTLQGEAGPLVIAHIDGRPLEILIESARILRWGP